MIDTAHEPPALHYQVAGNRPIWQARRTSRLPALWARAGRLYRPVLRRTVVPALALLAYGTMTRAFASADLLQQYLTALVLALVVGSVQTLLAPHGAGPTVVLPAAEPTSALEGAAQRAPVLAVTTASPEPAADKAFDHAVRRALTHLCDPTRLAVSPLLHLSSVTAGLHEQGLADTPFQRVAVLKAVLTDLVNGLQPQRRTEGCTGTASRFYNCLYYPYVLGITRRRAPTVLRDLRERRVRTGGSSSEQEQVLIWLLQVDEDTYYKWQRRASDTIALILRERERRLVCSPSLAGDARGMSSSCWAGASSPHRTEDRAVLRPVS